MRHVVLIGAAAALLGAAAAIWLSAGATPDLARTEVELAETVLEIPEGGGVLYLQVTTGRLPDRAELVLETADGRVLGSVTPFGQTGAAAEVQQHSLAVPLQGLAPGPVRVLPKIVLDGAARPARPEEFRGIRVMAE